MDVHRHRQCQELAGVYIVQILRLLHLSDQGAVSSCNAHLCGQDAVRRVQAAPAALAQLSQRARWAPATAHSCQHLCEHWVCLHMQP